MGSTLAAAGVEAQAYMPQVAGAAVLPATLAMSGVKALSSTLREVRGAETTRSDTLTVSGGVTARGDVSLGSSRGTPGATPGPSTRLASGGTAACSCS